MALTLAIAPMLIMWLTIATAPATIYIVIRYWNARSSILKRSRWRMVVAFIIAVLQIAAWIFFIYFIYRGIAKGGEHR
jgi:hypothetical protein